jgi:hypothetical protein
MNRAYQWIIALLSLFPLLSGCDAALTMGGKTVGISEGQFIYTDGYLKREYSAPFDRVWSAGEKTIADLKAKQVEKNRRIASGTITAMLQEEKIVLSISYVSKNLTSVAVRTGLTGNNLASRLIQEKIAGNLVEP